MTGCFVPINPTMLPFPSINLSCMRLAHSVLALGDDDRSQSLMRSQVTTCAP